MFKWLLNYQGSKLNKLESALLAKLQASLGPPGAFLLARQIHQINLVQRHSRSREVCCYTMKNRKPFHDPAYQFPAQAPELKFATVQFGQTATKREWKAEFFLVKGYFFSIVFTPSPADVHDGRDIEIQEVSIHHDPMRPIGGFVLKSINAEAIDFHGWIREWYERYGLSNLHEALSNEQRKKLIAELDSRLPPDYLEFNELSEGASLGRVEILGLSEIFEIVLPESTFYAVATVNGEGILATRRSKEDEGLYYLDYSRGDAVRLDQSFREAVEAFMAKRAS